jgi:N-acetylneuraminate synthase
MNLKDIQIGKYAIGMHHRPFIVAEMSGNHNQSLERAFELIDLAAKAGAHAVKIQTYTPDTMTIDQVGGSFSIQDPNSLWYNRNLYELYKEAYTPWEWHPAFFDHAKKAGILIFSTPFDETAVDMLEELNVPLYKIASFENNDIPLLRKVASTKKPVIISSGVSTVSVLDDAIRCLRSHGANDIVMLKCTSTYPATPENSHLNTIPHMSQLFQCHVGLSDHTMGVGAAVASVALGARVIEKHFTTARADGGVDSAFSIEPHELALLVEESHRAFLSLGDVSYGIQKTEQSNLKYKRSLYVVADIVEGERLTSDNIRVIRPADGLPPMYLDLVIGKRATRNIAKGTALSWDDLMK